MKQLMTLGFLSVLFSVFAYAGPGLGGGADPYLKFSCRSDDNKLSLVGDVSPSCLNEVKIEGVVNEDMQETCTTSGVNFIYSVLAKEADKVIISGSGVNVFHLISEGHIEVNTEKKSPVEHDFLSFRASFVYSSHEAGTIKSLVKVVNCKAEAFDQP
jgi:hypothetical protein